MLQSQGVSVELVQDEQCIKMMEKFIQDKPDLWNEDIHEEIWNIKTI